MDVRLFRSGIVWSAQARNFHAYKTACGAAGASSTSTRAGHETRARAHHTRAAKTKVNPPQTVTVIVNSGSLEQWLVAACVILKLFLPPGTTISAHLKRYRILCLLVWDYGICVSNLCASDQTKLYMSGYIYWIRFIRWHIFRKIFF